MYRLRDNGHLDPEALQVKIEVIASNGYLRLPLVCCMLMVIHHGSRNIALAQRAEITSVGLSRGLVPPPVEHTVTLGKW